MFEPKYLEMSRFNTQRVRSSARSTDFSLTHMRTGGLLARIAARLFRRLIVPVLFILQCLWPIVRWRRLMLVTRADDVEAILKANDAFVVPFGAEMQSLGMGATFLLGLEGPEHDRQRAIIRKVIQNDDLTKLEAQVGAFTRALLDASKGQIDAQQDLIRRVAAESCARYFGLQFDDADAFAEWTLACSHLLFADPFGDPTARDMAEIAAHRIGAEIDRTTKLLVSAGGIRSYSDTLVGRLVDLHLAGEADAPTLDEIRAILLGLSVGFVPTASMAGGKILDLLSRNGAARRELVDAAKLGDGDRFDLGLREAMRMAPAIAPGQWRWTLADTAWTRPGGRTFNVRKNTLILVATQIALRDPRRMWRPWKFEKDRPASASKFVFGDHPHSCLGEHIAMVQLRGILMPLLALDGVERSVRKLRVEWIGAFPDCAPLTFDHEDAEQAGHLIVIPANTGEAEDINGRIDKLDERLTELRAQLDQQGAIHFCSLTAVDAPALQPAAARGNLDRTDTLLLIEVNGDGDGRRAIAVLAQVLGKDLRDILALMGVEHGEDLAAFLYERRLKLSSKPWGATALQFYGRPGLSVRDIARQDRLARIADLKLQETLRENIGVIASASATLREVRRRIVSDEQAPEWDAYLLKPTNAKLDLSWWDDPQDSGYLLRVLQTRAVRRLGAALLAFAAFYAVAIGWNEGFRWQGWTSMPRAMGLAIAGVAVAFAGLGTLIGIFLAALRYKEARDIPDERLPSLAHLEKCARHEDRDGHVHNHILVVTALKKGLLRRFFLAFALWGIFTIVKYRFRPGFVLNMGTIHFARWVRLPGRDTMVFQSNYDGSWESYLEDFITRAHWGQSAAWSNGEGFPRTRFLVFGGAADGDHFKRYVRRKQVPTRFWYARFKQLTNAAMRRNALIHDGLARAKTESEAKSWLALFGSGQRLQGTLETDEIQSLVFTGFGKLRHSSVLMLRLAEDADANRAWLRALVGFRNASPLKMNFLESDNVKERRMGRVTFGEAERFETAASLALSAEGLRVLGLGEESPERGLDALPGPFAMGMSGRARRLGDIGEEAPENWRWSDRGDKAIHAALVLHGADHETLARLVKLHSRVARLTGIEIIEEIESLPNPANGQIYEHFGFRDGIVQPAIAGTTKANSSTVPADIIAPGEMVLGYANAQGYLTPGIPVDAINDPSHRLPAMPSDAKRYPRFGGSPVQGSLRDFGRNGSFIAIRQLEQHVERFEQAMDQAAIDVTRNYPELPTLLGHDINANWVSARLVGRWKNGASLLGNPLEPDRQAKARATMFGTDDPSGLQCPLGAHVRRANPRDSFEPGDPTELSIVNRHRLIRRGRSYERADNGHGSTERGLLFMAICEDLERQFEFVQRSWLDSPVFHELDQQNDPLVGRCPVGNSRSFEIPTSSGPVRISNLPQFVTVRAGGYFFLPSRSALLWLAGL